MRPQDQDKKLDELISRAVSGRDVTFDFDSWQKDRQEQIRDYKSQTENCRTPAPGQTQIWRLIMNSKITRLAVAAVIIIAVFIGLNQFGGSIDGTSVAWAEVAEKIEETRKMVFGVKPCCLFYAELIKQDKDVIYYGDTVTAEDVDAVLMRWKISEDEYRVIFGDLRAENVSAERLAELEAAVSE